MIAGTDSIMKVQTDWPYLEEDSCPWITEIWQEQRLEEASKFLCHGQMLILRREFLLHPYGRRV